MEHNSAGEVVCPFSTSSAQPADHSRIASATCNNKTRQAPGSATTRQQRNWCVTKGRPSTSKKVGISIRIKSCASNAHSANTGELTGWDDVIKNRDQPSHKDHASGLISCEKLTIRRRTCSCGDCYSIMQKYTCWAHRMPPLLNRAHERVHAAHRLAPQIPPTVQQQLSTTQVAGGTAEKRAGGCGARTQVLVALGHFEIIGLVSLLRYWRRDVPTTNTCRSNTTGIETPEKIATNQSLSLLPNSLHSKPGHVTCWLPHLLHQILSLVPTNFPPGCHIAHLPLSCTCIHTSILLHVKSSIYTSSSPPAT